ncbi:hypothetical protein [Paracoccus aerodenitrificans]|uniref:hypothetical protein n=1 Tax=Paracoccus aerodenitrificans TaxID=3017781 RepID=UPI0022F111D2|nr:hypothetical protein [Paracoccus aerodenitrificans]WBU64933.1 hypothetical protein PAE61_05755 [Paracoccus aerodenitrificans]
MSKRKQHAAVFKEKVALKAPEGDLTVADLASCFGCIWRCFINGSRPYCAGTGPMNLLIYGPSTRPRVRANGERETSATT